MSRVLITGAAGFIGMHTAIRFLKEGHEVVGIDNLNNYYSVDLKKDRLVNIENVCKRYNGNFSFYKADINSDIWNKIPKIDILIHLAAQAGVRYSLENPMAYLESNILGFQKVLDFVQSRAIHSFYYASSSSVYGKNSRIPFSEDESCMQPESYYAATKRANELMAFSYWKTHKISSVGLRFFTVYGPWGRPDMAPMLFAHSAFNKSSIKVFNNGNQSRDFTFVDDIVESIYQLVFCKKNVGFELINIGRGAPINLMDFIGCIEVYSGLKIAKNFLPEQIGDVTQTYADTSKLKGLTNFEPSISLEVGIEKFIKWYRSYYSYV